jgi:sortase A
LRVIERLLTYLGVLGLTAVGLAYLDSTIGQRQAIAAFNTAASADSGRQPAALIGRAPDQSLWSEKAKAAFTHSNPYDAVPVALLRLGRLDLEVPVFIGTDRLTLNRGAGLVTGTALPGEPGNSVISAHRDSFFRPLKDVTVGDTLELRTMQGKRDYVVTEIFITDPLDVSVLDPTDTPTLTLITCYPFYYVGFAPDRYIIRATPAVTDDITRLSASVGGLTALGPI